MSLSLNNTEGVQTNITTGHALKTAALSKNQQELEGEMALKLIASAAGLDSAALPTVGNSGYNINIKV
ncbi:MAG: hypothetical protein V7780_15940 [Colwellia sp.]|jgi:hypothetical protein|uniref:hypothetical protein n=1 Tax=Colwellia sp. Bg11-12 TaxID=2759817 RepID=UPI0015F563D0|nr:hypothetical protein [Colwellia sp. Bg11-12]MBA6262332.1 hypothetical protein [Colwellia sp. Bg11-12]